VVKQQTTKGEKMKKVINPEDSVGLVWTYADSTCRRCIGAVNRDSNYWTLAWEACAQVFATCVESFDASKGSFSTLLFRAADNKRKELLADESLQVSACTSYKLEARAVKDGAIASCDAVNEIAGFVISSGDATLASDDGESKETVFDVLEVEQTLPDAIVADEEENKARIDAVKRGLSALSSIEADVIIRRFGLAGNRVETLDEIAKSRGVTREAIRQTEEMAKVKMWRKIIGFKLEI